MDFFKRLGKATTFILVLCIAIIAVAEYLFLKGHQLHAIFMGLWVPTILGFMIILNLFNNGRK
ncbi:hypothetical protein [Aegicerativicinus sediminis]|uniref:hypothetical protein n=1 Tax=Aegicerativicinus sediminis TaxID=2893202 RepID=UPI001E59EC69|nr:hypothetical protein [Aegicerativicinus sediminis]